MCFDPYLHLPLWFMKYRSRWDNTELTKQGLLKGYENGECEAKLTYLHVQLGIQECMVWSLKRLEGGVLSILGRARGCHVLPSVCCMLCVWFCGSRLYSWEVYYNLVGSANTVLWTCGTNRRWHIASVQGVTAIAARFRACQAGSLTSCFQHPFWMSWERIFFAASLQARELFPISYGTTLVYSIACTIPLT